jgi:hypothetical protein
LRPHAVDAALKNGSIKNGLYNIVKAVRASKGASHAPFFRRYAASGEFAKGF